MQRKSKHNLFLFDHRSKKLEPVFNISFSNLATPIEHAHDRQGYESSIICSEAASRIYFSSGISIASLEPLNSLNKSDLKRCNESC